MENNKITITGTSTVRHTIDAFEALNDALESNAIDIEVDAWNATFDGGGHATITIDFDADEIRSAAIDRFYDSLPIAVGYEELKDAVVFNYSEDVFEYRAEQELNLHIDGDVLLEIARAAALRTSQDPYSDLHANTERLIDALVEGGYDA